MNRVTLLLSVALLLPVVAHSQDATPGVGALRNLANLREGVKRLRASSYDRTGGNRDFLLNIEAGKNSCRNSGSRYDHSHLGYHLFSRALSSAPDCSAGVLGRRDRTEHRSADRRLLRFGLRRAILLGERAPRRFRSRAQ